MTSETKGCVEGNEELIAGLREQLAAVQKGKRSVEAQFRLQLSTMTIQQDQLKTQLVTSRKEAAAAETRERELRDSLTRLERGFIALDDESNWLQCRWCEGENTGANPNHIGDCPFVSLAENPTTAALDTALAEARGFREAWKGSAKIHRSISHEWQRRWYTLVRSVKKVLGKHPFAELIETMPESTHVALRERLVEAWRMGLGRSAYEKVDCGHPLAVVGYPTDEQIYECEWCNSLAARDEEWRQKLADCGRSLCQAQEVFSRSEGELIGLKSWLTETLGKGWQERKLAMAFLDCAKAEARREGAEAMRDICRVAIVHPHPPRKLRGDTWSDGWIEGVSTYRQIIRDLEVENVKTG